MVARNTDADFSPQRLPSGVVGRFLRWWQRFLSTLVAASHTSPTRPATPTAGEPPAESRLLAIVRAPALVWAGGLAMLGGAALTVAISPAGTARSVAISAAVMSLIWGALRWALMRIVASETLARDLRSTRGAWAAGATVWILGVTPELRGLAWAASGAITWLVLERLGVTRRQALVCVGVAWGAQAFVVVGSWLARNAIIAILATRG